MDVDNAFQCRGRDFGGLGQVGIARDPNKRLLARRADHHHAHECRRIGPSRHVSRVDPFRGHGVEGEVAVVIAANGGHQPCW